MKLSIKILALAALAAATQPAQATDYLEIFFTTTADSYADGTPVKDGEWYGLVWVDDNVEFKGFNANGTLVNREDEAKFFIAGPYAKGGGVRESDGGGCFAVRASELGGRLNKGTWNIVLFDTRTPDVSAGELVYKASKGVNGRPTLVNSWGIVASIPGSGININLPPEPHVTQNVEIPAANESVLPSYPGGVDPIITGFDPAKGELTVDNTFSYIWYDVVGGATPGTFNMKKNLAADPKPGQTGTPITLKVQLDGESKFFKVIRHLPQEAK